MLQLLLFQVLQRLQLRLFRVQPVAQLPDLLFECGGLAPIEFPGGDEGVEGDLRVDQTGEQFRVHRIQVLAFQLQVFQGGDVDGGIRPAEVFPQGLVGDEGLGQGVHGRLAFELLAVLLHLLRRPLDVLIDEEQVLVQFQELLFFLGELALPQVDGVLHLERPDPVVHPQGDGVGLAAVVRLGLQDGVLDLQDLGLVLPGLGQEQSDRVAELLFPPGVDRVDQRVRPDVGQVAGQQRGRRGDLEQQDGELRLIPLHLARQDPGAEIIVRYGVPGGKQLLLARPGDRVLDQGQRRRHGGVILDGHLAFLQDGDAFGRRGIDQQRRSRVDVRQQERQRGERRGAGHRDGGDEQQVPAEKQGQPEGEVQRPGPAELGDDQLLER